MRDGTSTRTQPPDTHADSYAGDLAAIARMHVVPNVLEVVCRTTGMGFSAVARVTEDRWIACAVRDEISLGLRPGGELPIASTICSEIRQSGCLVAIDHVALDETFRDHHTAKRYGFQSYISVPVRRPDGRLFGTLCALDPRPAPVNNPHTIGMFKLFADLIGMHLDADDRLSASAAALATARQRADLQNQFVAVLGHDLRNPLSAIQTGTKMLQTIGLEQRAIHILNIIERSGARMAGLIDNVMDFTRSRLGTGLPVKLKEESDLRGMLDQVVSEMRTAQPDRDIFTDVDVRVAIVCDRARIGQLVANLLSNAQAHGEPGGPIELRARAGPEFELSVSNRGAAIAPATLNRLFEPFARGGDPSDSQGLGLGLYISAQIARAHGGTLEARSDDVETRFTFRMPARGR